MPHRRPHRDNSGSNTVEFTYCLVFIFFVILLPLVNYGTFMARWSISSQVVSAWVNSLAKKRKLSEAFARVHDQDFADAVTKSSGVKLKTITPALMVSRVDRPTETFKLTTPGKLPTSWQPNSGRLDYTFQVVVTADIEPLVTVQLLGLKVPGLTESAEVVMSGSSLWENMGRDPNTTEFYLNE